MIVNPDIEGDIPEEVYTFFRNLDNAVENGNKNAIRNLYEEKFDELTKACYVEGNIIVRPWPSSSLPQVKESFGSELALRLYDFLSNKHLFTYKLLKANSARTTWQNFSDLLRSLPNSSCDLPLSLIWDIFDEFIFQLTTVYQKQYFSEGEWSIPQVFNLLDEVVEKTDVLKSLSDTSTAEELTNNENLSFFSGFYAIITKAKVNVLLGDYYASLSVLTPLNIYKPEKNALQRSGSAALSLFYYIGVSYLMLHRYLDAYHCFMKCMKIKNATAKFAESVRLDAGYMLVCACVLGGIYLPNINMYLQTKKSTFDDDKETLKSGSVDRFGDVFERHSPKFLSVPAAGAQKGKVKGVDGKLLQQRMFNRAVQQQQHVIKMRGYFGVYQNTK
ncbi:translation initiation factor 3 subunit L [Angomonas deanei]|nr:translation initiation factor 3 subunit L [Angomonas deanei]|eukprot:EPY26326.1 translation initiation factor 3 subunit L [Angomonas deanei]